MSDTRDLVRKQFGAHAQRYVLSTDHSTGESLDRLVALVNPQPQWRALDVATGGGHTALALAPHVREVAASDITPEMLAAAEAFIRGKGITNVSFQEADADALPFEAGAFDLVTCRIAPHHFPDCARFMREVARVLKPGGVAAVIDNVVPEDPEAARFINDLEKIRDPSHHWAHPASEWIGFFIDAGLTIEAAELFRKARDFNTWMARLDVDVATTVRLEAMLRGASGPARESLAPEELEGKLRLYLTELLVVGRRGTEP